MITVLAESTTTEAVSGMTLECDRLRISKGMIAEYSHEQIHTMPRAELVEAVQAAEIPLVSEDRVPMMNREPLERLLFLARRSLRHQGY